MLKQSPRQLLFKDYAKELLRRYPQLKQEIMLCLTHVSDLWYEVMDKLVLPSGGGRPDLAIILKGKCFTLLLHMCEVLCLVSEPVFTVQATCLL